MSTYQTAQQIANQSNGVSPTFWIFYILLLIVISIPIILIIKHWIIPFFKAIKNWIKHWSSVE